MFTSGRTESVHCTWRVSVRLFFFLPIPKTNLSHTSPVLICCFQINPLLLRRLVWKFYCIFFRKGKQDDRNFNSFLLCSFSENFVTSNSFLLHTVRFIQDNSLRMIRSGKMLRLSTSYESPNLKTINKYYVSTCWKCTEWVKRIFVTIKVTSNLNNMSSRIMMYESNSRSLTLYRRSGDCFI